MPTNRSNSAQSLGGRIGAYRLHATHDARETTRAARTSFLSRFEREVDPDGVLPPIERNRRATAAKRAYFAKLALSSAKSRGRRKSRRGMAERHAIAHRAGSPR